MKVHNLVVTGSLTSGGENISTISSSVASTVTNVSSSVSASISQLSSSMVSTMTSLSSSLTSSMGGLSSSMLTTMTNLSSSMVSVMATTGSNTFVGNQTISGSIIPAVNSTYDLGSPTNEFRHLYLSSASLYIDGTKVLGSTTQELQITTDAGQSFKILEAGSDTITLQAADGNITLATSGGGDVILDPTTGIIALKGTTTVYAGNKILSSDGNAIQFGNSVTMTGSLIVTGFIETQELRTTYISSSILYRSGSTKFGDELSDTHAFSGSVSISGSLSVPGSNLVSGSSQVISLLPSGTISGSSQVLSGTGIWSGSAQLPSGVISGSAQLPSGTVSGSSQITLSATTGYGSVLNQAVLTSSSPTFAGLTNSGSYLQSTTSTQPVMIYGDSALTNGLFRIQIDEVNDGFATGTRTYLGDGGNDIFIGTGNSSYTPANTYIALNHSGEISMGAGSGTKHFILSTSGDATFSNTIVSKGYKITGNYSALSSIPETGIYGTDSSFSDGYGGIIIASRTDAARPIIFGTYNGTTFGDRVKITGAGTLQVKPNTIGTSDTSDRSIIIGSRPSSSSIASLGFDTGGTYRGDFDFSSSSGDISYWHYNGTSWNERWRTPAAGGFNIYNASISITETGVSSFSTSYSSGRVQFGMDSAGTDGFYFRTYNSGYADRFSVRSNGRVIIGSASPNGYLDVRGSHVGGYGIVNVVSTDNCVLALDSTGTQDVRFRIKYGGTDKWFTGIYLSDNYDIRSSDNTLKISIPQSGSITFGATLLPTSDTSYNLGSTSYRWGNLYTTDLHLSNEGSQNSVDGTWGDWTLQEGENDIFMLNNRNGEKFKIKLEKIV